jgi:AraC-like DNA-binding protein
VAAPQGAAGARHVILYYLVTEGHAGARVGDGPTVALEAGDIVFFPHGDAHVIANSGGVGEMTRLVCGYIACDPHVSKGPLGGLPPLLRVRIGDDAAGQWLENSIRFAAAEGGGTGAGAEAVRVRLAEVLLVETLRSYVSMLPTGTTGWLAGALDTQIGRALAVLHGDPSHPWTVENLAKRAGISRSVLAERFQQRLGEAPIAYLTRWRLKLAAQRLATSSHGVARIAADVGYRSEAAFNRAFKREFGLPPARFRGRSKVEGSAVHAQ